MNKVDRLREELWVRDEVIKRLRANMEERYTLEMENRLQKQELKKLKDGIRQLVQHDKRLQHKFAVVSAALPKIEEDAVIPGDIDDVVATIQALAPATGNNYVVTQPMELLADIFSFLNRLRTAVASLGPQNFRILTSVRLEVIGLKSRRHYGTVRGGRGRARHGLGATHQHYLNDDKNTFKIAVEYSSDPTALKKGVIKATGKLEWSFDDMQEATSYFVGLLRNASVRQMSLAGPSSHQFVQVSVVKK